MPPGWEFKDRLVQFVEVDQMSVAQQSFVPYACVRSSFIGSARGSVLRREEWFVKPSIAIRAGSAGAQLQGWPWGLCDGKGEYHTKSKPIEYTPNFRYRGQGSMMLEGQIY